MFAIPFALVTFLVDGSTSYALAGSMYLTVVVGVCMLFSSFFSTEPPPDSEISLKEFDSQRKPNMLVSIGVILTGMLLLLSIYGLPILLHYS